MDNFRVIYEILKILEQAMDAPEFDYSLLSYEKFGITEYRYKQILMMMQKNGYIDGLHIYSFMSDKGEYDVKAPIRPKITLQGLEYLHENSMMKKVHNIMKGIVELIP